MTVVVIGDVAADVVVVLDEPVAFGSDARATNRLLGGGAGANVATWLSEEGVPTTLIARIGDDSVGRDQAAALAARVTAHLAVDAVRPTGMVVALVGPDGERTFFPDRGANAALDVADLPPGVLESATHLHLSGYVLLDAGSREAGRAALARAQAAGVTTSVDLSSTAPLAALPRGAFLSWTGDVDICKGNAAEAMVLVGGETSSEACGRLGARYRHAVVTDGRHGSWVCADGGPPLHRPATYAQVVDTVGAGDAFTAGFLAAWVKGASCGDAASRGADLAARAAGTRGGRPA